MYFDHLAFAISAILLVICVWLVVYLKFKEVSVNSIGVVIFAAPILFYLVFSGTITQFSGLGIEAKFRDVRSLAIDDVLIEEPEVLGQGAPTADLETATMFQQAQRVIVINSDLWASFDNFEARERGLEVGVAIYHGLLSGGFQGVLVTDGSTRPVGFFEKHYFYDLLRIPLDRAVVKDSQKQFVLSNDQILSRFDETNLAILLKHPARRAEIEGNKAWKRFDTPAVELLSFAREHRVDVITLTDLRGEYVGVVSRSRLVDFLVDKMLSQSSR